MNNVCIPVLHLEPVHPGSQTQLLFRVQLPRKHGGVQNTMR